MCGEHSTFVLMHSRTPPSLPAQSHFCNFSRHPIFPGHSHTIHPSLRVQFLHRSHATMLSRSKAPASRLISIFSSCRTMSYDAEHVEEFRETVRNFAQGFVAPYAAAIDATNSFPKGRFSFTFFFFPIRSRFRTCVNKNLKLHHCNTTTTNRGQFMDGNGRIRPSRHHRP